MKLLCLSDIHGEAAGLRAVLPDAAGADVVVLAGDLTHLGGRLEAQALLAPVLALGLPVLAVAGNMEYEGVRSYIAEKGIDIHGRGVLIDGVGFMGLGGGTPSPFHSPWELTDAEARPVLAAGHAQIANASFKVLVSHPPPRGTTLDRSRVGVHVGSQAVRDFIDVGAVDLCLCGHIHEAVGEERIGNTLCVNLGPFKSGSYALITIEGDRAHVDWRKK
ncbi:MAG TPA: metallophosphoesterase [Spirochaetia bacterium]|nr:metallophosphoesterase [Spirochaetia bacterium]